MLYGSTRCLLCLPPFEEGQRERRRLVNRKYYETLTDDQRRKYRMRNQARRGIRPYWFKRP